MSTKNYPSFLQAVLLIVLTAVLQFSIGRFIRVLFRDSIGSLAFPYVPAVVNTVSFGIVILVASRRRALRLQRFGDPLLLASIVITIVGLQMLLSEIDNLTRLILPMPMEFASLFDEVLSSSNLQAAVVLLVVVAPLTEELLFRGIILPGFLARYSPRASIVLCALLFGLLHLNPWQFAGAFLLGMYLSYLYMKTRSLAMCIVGHAVNNSLPLIIIHATGLDVKGYTTGFGERVAFQPLWFDLVGVLFAAVGFALLAAHGRDRKEPAG